MRPSKALLFVAFLGLACSLFSPAGGALPVTPADGATPTPLPVATTTAAAEPEITVQHPDNLSAGDPYTPDLGNGGYDVQRYTLRVALRPGVEALEAAARIELESTQPDLRQVSLDFVGFEISALTVDGTPVAYGRTARKLLVDLPAALAAGEPATLEVAYSGAPVQEPSEYVPFIGHLGLQFQPDHIYVVSEPDGARYWFPANDHPRDKAEYRFEISVPPGQTGVANGELVETSPGGAAFAGGQPGDLFVWEHNFPMASYQATVAVGAFVRVDDTSPAGVPLRSYMVAADQARYEPYRAPIGEMVDWIASQLGPYPFDAFGYVLVGGLGGALETQTMVVTDRDGLSENLLAHELAHQWFGDWVSLHSWQAMWRSEGFATYLAWLWAARDDPDSLAADLAPALARGSQAPFSLGNPPPRQLFSGLVYDEGALLVADLRQTMGDEAFYAGLRLYFERYGGGTASDAEFQAVMEEAAGRSLEEVLTRWLD